VSTNGRSWVVARHGVYQSFAILRDEWGRKAWLADRPGQVRHADEAIRIVLRDYARITAPRGCKDPVGDMEREAPALHSIIARALERHDYLTPEKPLVLTQENLDVFVTAALRGEIGTPPMGGATEGR
jgi:hypothetical protein